MMRYSSCRRLIWACGVTEAAPVLEAGPERGEGASPSMPTKYVMVKQLAVFSGRELEC